MSHTTDASPADVPDLLPARMVNEFVYCPRLVHLEWVQGEWADNAETVDGRFVHRRVDDESTAAVPDAESTDEDRSLSARSLLLSSAALGVIARIDLVELEGRQATHVDYKRGAVPDVDHQAYDPERVQLCLQGLILREHGYDCTGGVLYYATSRTRVNIEFDDALVALTRDAVAGLRALGASGRRGFSFKSL